MSDDQTGQGLPTPDMTGHVPLSPESPFTLTVEDAVERYAQLGHPRNPRSIRRFCQQGSIDCRKVRTSNFSELYLIDPASIDRHVKEISETFPTSPADMTAHNLPKPDKAGHGLPRPDTQIEMAQETRYVALLEKITADQAEQLKTKDEQLKVKDTQIAAMLERDRETNFLIRGLQTLLGLPERQEPAARRATPNEEAPLSPGS